MLGTGDTTLDSFSRKEWQITDLKAPPATKALSSSCQGLEESHPTETLALDNNKLENKLENRGSASGSPGQQQWFTSPC